MRRLRASLAAMLVVCSLIVAGWSQSTSALAASQSPATPARAAEFKAVAAAPAKVPTPAQAKKVDYPEKGKSITFLVPWPAGGGSDIGGRLLANDLEKILDTRIVVVNKAGAGSQVGLTDFVMKAKPDGYTVALTNFPATSTVYLDPRRQATFGRKDFLPLALHAEDGLGLAVRADSPWKSVKEVFAYVKANPLKLRTSTSGLLSPAHVSEVLMEKEFGLKFTIVHFDGGAAEGKAIMDGSVDVGVATIGSAYGSYIRNGAVRPLGIATKEPSPIWPGVPTWESEGYPFYASSSRGLALPAGTPKEIVEILGEALKKAMANEETRKKMATAGMVIRYMGPEAFARFWDEQDAKLKPIVEDAARAK